MVHAGPVIGLAALLALLAGLAGTLGLGAAGWLVGAGCGVLGSVLLARALARHGVAALGPADQVTLTRAVLACGVAALTADSFARPVSVPALVAFSASALVLDGIDGRVARRTSTSSEFGARFDLDADAFLILVLSVYVARSLGAWVLLIGLARYAFVAAGWRLAWLREPAPPRYWCKVVAAIQGVLLTVVSTGLAPRSLSVAAVAAASILLAESFGREAWEKWRRRSVELQPNRVVVALLGKQARAG
jgi:phosphatidylglycerophosphate synthase